MSPFLSNLCRWSGLAAAVVAAAPLLAHAQFNARVATPQENARAERSVQPPQPSLPYGSAGLAPSCNREIPPLAPQKDTLLFWLPSGARSLPDMRQLRPGDGLVVRAESAREALETIREVQASIRAGGGTAERYKYIVRTFPKELQPTSGGVPFFQGISADEKRQLQESAFAIMFDHERHWYDKDRGMLPAWTWDYNWTLSQVRTLSRSITDNCIPAGALVTPSARKEGRWTRPDGGLMENGFARLLDTRTTGLNYLIVQAQPRCRADASGREYGQFARQLRRELRNVFPNDPGRASNLIMQVSIDDDVHKEKGANYVPADWTAACLNATAEPGSDRVVNGFFLWSGSKKATCQTVQRVRGGDLCR